MKGVALADCAGRLHQTPGLSGLGRTGEGEGRLSRFRCGQIPAIGLHATHAGRTARGPLPSTASATRTCCPLPPPAPSRWPSGAMCRTVSSPLLPGPTPATSANRMASGRLTRSRTVAIVCSSSRAATRSSCPSISSMRRPCQSPRTSPRRRRYRSTLTPRFPRPLTCRRTMTSRPSSRSMPMPSRRGARAARPTGRTTAPAPCCA